MASYMGGDGSFNGYPSSAQPVEEGSPYALAYRQWYTRYVELDTQASKGTNSSTYWDGMIKNHMKQIPLAKDKETPKVTDWHGAYYSTTGKTPQIIKVGVSQTPSFTTPKISTPTPSPAVSTYASSTVAENKVTSALRGLTTGKSPMILIGVGVAVIAGLILIKKRKV